MSATPENGAALPNVLSPPEMVPRPKWLTVRQAAKALQVHWITVYRAIYAGHLRAGRIGRNVRIPWEALQEYLFRPKARARLAQGSARARKVRARFTRRAP